LANVYTAKAFCLRSVALSATALGKEALPIALAWSGMFTGNKSLESCVDIKIMAFMASAPTDIPSVLKKRRSAVSEKDT